MLTKVEIREKEKENMMLGYLNFTDIVAPELWKEDGMLRRNDNSRKKTPKV